VILHLGLRSVAARENVVIEAVRENAERKRFGFRDGFAACCAVAENSGQVGDLSDPASIVFLFDVDSELAGLAHAVILTGISHTLIPALPSSAFSLTLFSGGEGAEGGGGGV
jgi:hypothetical protein